MYFRPNPAVAADVIPYYKDGEFKLFYLKDFRNRIEHGEGVPWCLLTTEDFVHYTDHGEVLVRGTVEEQDLYVFTGCIIENAGEYWIYYTGHNPNLRAKGLPEQKVLLAKSKDMLHWEKQPDFVMEAPDFLEIHDFRDPFVYFDEEHNVYKMLLAARLKEGPVQRRGCTVAARSTDLINWTVDKEPFYAPNSYFTHECPDLFRMGDWYYLIFSEFSDKNATRYRMSKSPNGPWITPAVDTFDGHSFYAAKTASDGRKRFLFGWNCIRDKELDYEPWQWGGTIIVHELVQNEDGTLYVKLPDTIEQAFKNKQKVNIFRKYGFVNDLEQYEQLPSGQEIPFAGWEQIKLGGDKYSFVLFNEMPKTCKIKAKFRAKSCTRDFGFCVRMNDSQDEGYYVKFEPQFNRVAFDRNFRRFADQHIMIESERYCPMSPEEWNDVIMIADGTVLEVYINGAVAMSVRMFDYTAGRFGIYAADSDVIFKEIELFTLES